MRYTVDAAHDEYGGLISRIKPGDTVVDGAWTITLTAEGIECDCGKGAYCPLNPQTRTPIKGKTKLCNICKSIRVPVGTHACEVCE